MHASKSLDHRGYASDHQNNRNGNSRLTTHDQPHEGPELSGNTDLIVINTRPKRGQGQCLASRSHAAILSLQRLSINSCAQRRLHEYSLLPSWMALMVCPPSMNSKLHRWFRFRL